eukprot:scaffold43363_cov19-Tisochrysis_lutea.AAC.1
MINCFGGAGSTPGSTVLHVAHVILDFIGFQKLQSPILGRSNIKTNEGQSKLAETNDDDGVVRPRCA